VSKAIDPALGLELVPSRTLKNRSGTVTVLIPAHNEEATVAEVVTDAFKSLDILGVNGEVVVSASGCTDDTASLAAQAGAIVVEAPKGKGNAVSAGLRASTADIICLIDGDFRYFGESPLATALVAPILRGIVDVTIADLYWRPLYPQLWLYGFFAPLSGRLFPEILPKVGATPWSGQRAAPREMWPTDLPEDFTVDLALLLHWNDLGLRMRPVIADDWTNPQRPKPELLRQEHAVLINHGIKMGRIEAQCRESLELWYVKMHGFMAEYRPNIDDPQLFERDLLGRSLAELNRLLGAC
jgi:glycosyltransferase involved in cell wall biosynthesis